MGKPKLWILIRSGTNQAVQLLEMARGLKFCIYEVEVLYYPSSENKATAKVICVFVFAYAKRWFSHNVAQIMSLNNISMYDQVHIKEALYDLSNLAASGNQF